VIALSTTGCAPKITTILLVRHADVGAGSDPPLNAAGQQRAQELVDVADNAGLVAIYTTQFQRTQQTAAPLASATGITPAVFNVGNSAQQHAQDVAADILANHGGKAVLVVGHSNTVPMIIEALGFTPAPSLSTSQFDRLFIVRKKQNSSTHLIEARYGP
jgi:broad specificity phosphatase PhoE